MGGFQNFADMLEKKIRQEIREEMIQDFYVPFAAPETPNVSETSYLHLGWLLGQTPVVKAPKAYSKTPYVHAKPLPKTRPAHQLGPEAQGAYAVLKRFSPEFADNFTKDELRKTYRKALLATHPDQGGHAQDFWDVRQAYTVLKAVLN